MSRSMSWSFNLKRSERVFRFTFFHVIISGENGDISCYHHTCSYAIARTLYPFPSQLWERGRETVDCPAVTSCLTPPHPADVREADSPAQSRETARPQGHSGKSPASSLVHQVNQRAGNTAYRAITIYTESNPVFHIFHCLLLDFYIHCTYLAVFIVSLPEMLWIRTLKPEYLSCKDT